MIWRLTLTALLTMFCTLLAAQDNKYKNYKYEWPEERPKAIPVEEQFKNADAVVLEEKLIMNLVNFTNVRKTRIKFLKQEGINKHSTIVLPVSNDPQGDLNAVPFWEKDTVHRPLGEHTSLLYFAVRIIKPDGSIVKAQFNDRVQKFNHFFNKINRTYLSWFMNIAGIVVGDEVEIAVAYNAQFNFGNYFNRVFFNGDLDKQNFELVIRYPNSSLFFFQNHNGAPVPDTGIYKGTSPNSYEYTWKAKNLKACINEKKARPYMELPYVSFYSHQNDYGTLSSNKAYIEKSLPYPWEFIFLGNNNFLIKTEPGYVNYLPESMKLKLSKKDPETISVKRLVEEHCGNDSNKTSCLNKIHNLITDSFDYEKNYDPEYEYMNEDYSSVHKSIDRKILREEDRIDLYTRICYRLETDYFHCRLYDKRFNAMNYDVYYPSAVYNLFYALPYKGTYFFYFPKMQRAGYYVNELPFYFEDINTMLIPQTVANSEKNDPNKNITFPRVTTPFSTISDNTRTTNVMCNISLQNKTASFDTRLNLSGQFSTLTRGFYLYGEMDSTLEACYYKPVYELSNSSKLVSKELTSRKATYPYECNFRLKYTDNSTLTFPYSGTAKINLKNWFNNLYDPKLETKNRVMNYYPDFVYSDMHRYMIKLDKPAEISNIAEFNFKEENTFGKYTVSLKVIDESSYMLETTLIVNAEKVQPYNISDVKKIFDLIEKMNNAELALKEK